MPLLLDAFGQSDCSDCSISKQLVAVKIKGITYRKHFYRKCDLLVERATTNTLKYVPVRLLFTDRYTYRTKLGVPLVPSEKRAKTKDDDIIFFTNSRHKKTTLIINEPPTLTEDHKTIHFFSIQPLTTSTYLGLSAKAAHTTLIPYNTLKCRMQPEVYLVHLLV